MVSTCLGLVQSVSFIDFGSSMGAEKAFCFPSKLSFNPTSLSSQSKGKLVVFKEGQLWGMRVHSSWSSQTYSANPALPYCSLNSSQNDTVQFMSAMMSLEKSWSQLRAIYAPSHSRDLGSSWTKQNTSDKCRDSWTLYIVLNAWSDTSK